MTKKKVAIIGAGLQAKRRAPAIVESANYEVALVVDHNEKRAQDLAGPIGAKTAKDHRAAIDDASIEIVLVLTYPDSHAEISIAAMNAGKHVLCEKPLSRTVEEARAMIDVAKKTGRVLKCGFNHRHHPAVREAYARITKGEIGKPVFGRARYGIGGRVGVEKEWRSDPKIVSGGQLMEQGIHLVDLFRWFIGDAERVTGMTTTSCFPIAPLEDNGFLLMQMRGGVICSIHSSLTQWTNLFEMEIYGEKGSLTIDGLGATYGVEKLHVAPHDPSAPFSHHTIEWRGGDVSWKGEWEEMIRAIEEKRAPLGSAEDGLRAMEIVNAVYDASKSGRTISFSG